MITDQKHIDFYKKIANDQYLLMVLSEYGQDKQSLLIQLTDGITDIYKHLKYSSFKTVIIYTPIDLNSSLDNITGANATTIQSYENLSPLVGDNIIIEIKRNGDLNYAINFPFDINFNKHNAIIYKRDSLTDIEMIYGKSTHKSLIAIPESDSYFAFQTYKTLEQALEDYNSKIARHSECLYLKNSWYDDNKLCFGTKPEHKLRDSLLQFLINLRNAEARPEQVVDKSHPVDIKVTFKLAPHLALIEIKWLGLSINKKRKVTGDYTGKKGIKRINKGAKQLADYLDGNIKRAPTNNSKGYLVVFDARRENCNSSTLTISKADGLKYQSEVISITPDYNKIRSDFSKPYRFFMEPDNMTP